MVLNVFACACLTSVYPLWSVSSGLCLCSNVIVFFLLSLMSSLYILDRSTLANMWFANIFSWSVAYRFIFLMEAFAEKKKLWNLIYLFSFMNCSFVIKSNIFLTLGSKDFLLFSSKSFLKSFMSCICRYVICF